MEMSAPACSASMNTLVPDLAMVPRLLIMSVLVMPMPVSSIVSVLFALSADSWILSSGSAPSLAASVSDS